jgi:hypothetical protein
LERLGRLVLVALTGFGCTTSPLEPESDALTRARSRWATAAVESYRFEFQRFCFCAPDFIRRIRVEVIDGSVRTVVYVDSSEPVPDPTAAPVIEDLFEEIQDAIDRQAHSLVTEYDAELGHPTEVSIDYLEFAVDEEMAFSVTAFEAL